MNINDMDISPELREKAKACKTPEEILALAKKEGIKLSEAQLEEVAGGGSVWSSEKVECPYCATKFSIDLDACPNCGLSLYKGPALEY